MYTNHGCQVKALTYKSS